MSPCTGRPSPLAWTPQIMPYTVYGKSIICLKKTKVCSAGASSGLSRLSSSALAGTPLWLCLFGNRTRAGLKAQGAEASRSPTCGCCPGPLCG